MQENSYYNTTHLRGQQLAQYETQARRQEDKVLAFAKANPDLKFTAEDVRRLVMPRAPRTSAGRALTNLQQAHDLDRLDEQVEGEYGRPIYLYRLGSKHRLGQHELDLSA